MDRRRVVQVGALVWAGTGAAVAFASLGSANADARVLVVVMSVAGLMAAVAASVAVSREVDRWAGGLLLASAVTPTYFAYVLNVPAVVVGFALLITPGLVFGRSVRTTGQRQFT